MAQIRTYLFLSIISLMLLVTAENAIAQCPAYIYAGDDTTICYSENSVRLNGVILRSDGNALSGFWSGGTGTYNPNSTTKSTVYVPSLAEVNTGFVKLVLNSSSSCSGLKTDTVKITIQKVTESNITGPTAICEYSSGNSYQVSAVGGITYQWHINGGSITSGSATNSVNVSWGAYGPGYIYLIQTDALGCKGISTMDPVSRFHFNTQELKHAEIGTDATNVDSDAKSDGSGFYLPSTASCGASKGIDLVVPGSNFNRGKMCMSIRWQRDESQASFFKRGGTEFSIDGGNLYVKLTQTDSLGGSKVIGPVNTNYSVPFDDAFRTLTFCYDSATGIARVLVNDALVWNYNTGKASSLYWTGAGNATIGAEMDGNCVGKALIDWMDVSIPVSIYPKPVTVLSGTNPACQFGQYAYTCDTPSTVTYTWSAPSGNVLSGVSGPASTIYWEQSGAQQAKLLLVKNSTGCDSTFSFNVNVTPAPGVSIQGNDSICKGDTQVFTKNSSGQLYSWYSNTSSSVSTQNSYTLSFDSTGSYFVYLQSTDTLTSCFNRDTFPVWIQDYPDPSLSTPSALCLNGTTMVTVTNASGMNFSWTASGGSILSGQNTDEIQVQYTIAGNYSIEVQVTDPAFGCNTNEEVNVLVHPKPVTGALYHY